MKIPEHRPLARGVVWHVGDAVAVVVGEDKYRVIDAAEDVVVEYDPLPVVTEPEAALQDGSALVHEQFGTNKTHEWELAGGDVDRALADAEVVIERRIVKPARPAARSSRAACWPSTAAGSSRSGARPRSRTSCARSWPASSGSPSRWSA